MNGMSLRMLSVLIACAGVADLDRFKISLSASTVLDFPGGGCRCWIDVDVRVLRYLLLFLFFSPSLFLSFSPSLISQLSSPPNRGVKPVHPRLRAFFFHFHFFQNQKRSEVKRRQAQDRSTQLPGRNPDTGVTIYRRTTIPWRRAALRARQYSSSLSYSDSEQLSSEDSVR